MYSLCGKIVSVDSRNLKLRLLAFAALLIVISTFYYSQSTGLNRLQIYPFNDPTPFALSPYCGIAKVSCAGANALRGPVPVLDIETDFDGNLSSGWGSKVNVLNQELRIMKADRTYPFLTLIGIKPVNSIINQFDYDLIFRNSIITVAELFPYLVIYGLMIFIFLFTFLNLPTQKYQLLFPITTFLYFIIQYCLGIFSRGSDIKYLYRAIINNDFLEIFEGFAKSALAPTQTFSAIGLEPRNLVNLIACCSIILFLSTQKIRFLYLIPLSSFISISQSFLFTSLLLVTLLLLLFLAPNKKVYFKLLSGLMAVCIFWIISTISIEYNAVVIEFKYLGTLNFILIFIALMVNIKMCYSYKLDHKFLSTPKWAYWASFISYISVTLLVEFLSRISVITLPDDKSDFMWIRAFALEGQGRLVTGLSFLFLYLFIYQAFKMKRVRKN